MIKQVAEAIACAPSGSPILQARVALEAAREMTTMMVIAGCEELSPVALESRPGNDPSELVQDIWEAAITAALREPL